MKYIYLDILAELSAEDPETAKYFNSSLCLDTSLEQKLKEWQKVIDWITEHGRKPSQYSKDKLERKYGFKIISYKGTMAKGTNSPEIYQFIIDNGMGYILESKNYLEDAIKGWQEIIDWVIDNGRSPLRYNTKDKTEIKYYRRIEHYRKGLNGKKGGSKPYPEVNQLIIDNDMEYVINTKNFNLKKWMKENGQ